MENISTTYTNGSAEIKEDKGVSNYTRMGLFMVALVINVFGNSLIIAAIVKYPWLQKKAYVALQMLAIADLLVSIHIVGIFITELFNVPVLCEQIFGLFRGFILYAAAYHVILVAMERFIAIMFPLYYQTKMTSRQIRVCSLILWIVSIPTNAGEVFLIFRHLSPGKQVLFATIPYLAMYIFLTCSLCFLHGKVTLTAKLVQQRRKKENDKENTVGFKLDRPTKMMLVVVGLYLLLWSGVFISSFITLTMTTTEPWLGTFRDFSMVFGTLNSSINVLVYTAFNDKLRLAFKILLHLDKSAPYTLN